MERKKFSEWRVYRKSKSGKVVELKEETPRPMTADEALKHFNVNIIQAIID